MSLASGLKAANMFRQARRLFSSQWKTQRDADMYANKAIKEGMRSRAAYKLEEINKKCNQFLQPGAYVVDLGAAPGGFSMVAANNIALDSDINRWHSASKGDINREPKKTKRTLGGIQIPRKYGQLICVDRTEMVRIAGAKFVQGDMQDTRTHTQLRQALDGHEADVVVSDMAPDTTGEKETNHVRIMELADLALHLAQDVLRNGGTFVCKLFSGAEERDFRARLAAHFIKVRMMRPAASRQKSPEVYYVAQGYVPPHLRAAPP